MTEPNRFEGVLLQGAERDTAHFITGLLNVVGLAPVLVALTYLRAVFLYGQQDPSGPPGFFTMLAYIWGGLLALASIVAVLVLRRDAKERTKRWYTAWALALFVAYAGALAVTLWVTAHDTECVFGCDVDTGWFLNWGKI